MVLEHAIAGCGFRMIYGPCTQSHSDHIQNLDDLDRDLSGVWIRHIMSRHGFERGERDACGGVGEYGDACLAYALLCGM